MQRMRLALPNGGKWAGFAAAALLSASLAAQASPSALRGVVTRPDGARAAGVAVSFHAVRVCGIAGLRAGGERIDVWRTTTDADGRFALDVPASLALTCLAETGSEVGVVAPVVAGPGLVRVELVPVERRLLEIVVTDGPGAMSGEVTFDVNFEGPGPLAPRRLTHEHGRVALPDIPGHGAVLLPPVGFVSSRTGDVWMPGSGYDRDRIRLSPAPRRELAVRWAAPVGVSGARRGPMVELWGAATTAWHGQLADGTPFLAAEDTVVRLPGVEAVRVVPTGEPSARAILIAHVSLVVGSGELSFAVADELVCAGGSARLPSWLPEGVPHLVVIDGCSGPRLLGVGGEAAWRVIGRVRDGEGVGVAGVTARVRRVAAAGELPQPSIEATSGPGGGFVLPVRLPPGAYEVLAAATDGRQAHRTFTVGVDDARVDLVLDVGARLHGLLVDADGEPAAGVRVDLLLGADDIAASFGWPERFAFTNRRGEFAFAGLIEGAAYEVSCDSAAYGGVVANGATPGGDAVLLQLRAGPAPR